MTKSKGFSDEVSRMAHASVMERKFQGCFKKVSGVFQGRLKGVFSVFQGYFKEVLMKIQGHFRAVLMKFSWCFKKISRGLQKVFSVF